MSETDTAWILVQKLAPNHNTITEDVMKSGGKIPPVKTEKVWVEGEIVSETEDTVTIDDGEEWFTQEKRRVQFSMPPGGGYRREEYR